MKKFLALVICAFATLIVPTNTSVAQETLGNSSISAEVIEVGGRSLNRAEQASRDSAVKVALPGGGHGSGTYIKFQDHYLVLTAAHVVDTTPFAYVLGQNQERVLGQVIYLDPYGDIAFLKIPRMESRTPVNYRTQGTENIVGTDLVYTGYPSHHDLLTIRGSASGLEGSRGYIVMQSYAWFGASGSGVFDERGRLVGVVSALSVERYPWDSVIETIVYVAPVGAIRASVIREAL